MIPELLAPAGNIEILKAAALSGADAVYFGGDLYGARAFAGNLSHDEVLEAVEFLHTHGKKAYLTVNTLLKNREIEEGLFSYLRDFYEAGLDAVLVQDVGVLSFLKSCFPELTIHASTQMCISSPFGYEFLKNLGVARAVPARELSLDEIRTLSAVSGIETEVFVHGAMCVCYSGRCYLSGMIGGRSANRGRCGQPCRLPYEGYIDNNKTRLPGGGKYPISMKDLCGLPVLKELCESGVDSLKIEGRMKSKEYVTGVVSVYRKYLDLLAEDPDRNFVLDQADLDFLRALGNRGNFAHIYYEKNNGPEMISFSDSSFHSDPAALAQARAASGHQNGSSLSETAPVGLSVNLAFTAKSGHSMRLSASSVAEDGQEISIAVTGDIVETASKKATTEAEVLEKLGKLGGTGFTAGKVDIELGENIFLPMSKVNALRREAVEMLQDQLQKQMPPDRVKPEENPLGSP
ncbi:MAG: U32 family peptidase, partial [Lachnospiraceae bacterium]|nr:U32 family peptidase [Lachnospiraceae bacterium]